MDTLGSDFRTVKHLETGDAPPAQGQRAFYRPARAVVARIRRVKSFVAGILIGLSVWTPIFVATTAEEAAWQPYGLPGGMALFSAGIWLRFGRPFRRGHPTQPRDPAGPSRPRMDRLAA